MGGAERFGKGGAMASAPVGFDMVRWSSVVGVEAVGVAEQAYRTVGAKCPC